MRQVIFSNRHGHEYRPKHIDLRGNKQRVYKRVGHAHSDTGWKLTKGTSWVPQRFHTANQLEESWKTPTIGPQFNYIWTPQWEDTHPQKCYKRRHCLAKDVHSLLLLPHPLPLLRGVDVSYETPPLNSVFRFLSCQFSLRQVFLDVIQLSPLWSSSPFPRHLYHHHSLDMPIPLQPTFLHFRGYFSHLRCPSFLILSSLVTPLIHLNIIISATFNFFSCAFFTAQTSAPYIIAGLTTVLYSSLWLSNLFFGHTDTLF